MRGCAAVRRCSLPVNSEKICLYLIRVESKTEKVHAASAELCGSDDNVMFCPLP